MKIALIQCPVWGTYDPPLALAQLFGCLKKEKHEVYVLDLNIKLYLNCKENYKNMWAWEQSLFWYDPGQVKKFFRDNNEDIENYVKDIINTGAKIVGFSVNAASRLSSIELAKRLKERDRRLIIVFGGPLFFERGYVDSILLNEGGVDIIIPGEGEVTFCELLKLIENKQDITACCGISFKKDGRIINTGSRELLNSLDSLPFLDFTDLALSDYDDSKHIPFMASRGCTQACVFCSSRTFWPGYRTMSGERIFKEIEFHKRKQSKENSDIGHVDFLDLLFNGNMKSLVDFCDLMSKARLDIYWTANMIIRPEMTPEIIKKMKDSGCEHIIFGIESGSQRLLGIMRKHYRIEDADRIIRWLHEVGIVVTCNFMFGFPGETEEDFKKTLDFIKRNAEFLDRVYPSRTFCALEEFSYFHSHLKEFGIKSNPPNHLYWETIDGENIYPERLRRCEEFCNLASSLGIEVGCGVQTTVELDKWYNLGFYYEYKKDFAKAVNYFLNYYKLDSVNEVINNKILTYYVQIEGDNSEILIDEGILTELKKAASEINKIKTGEVSDITITRLGREQSIALFMSILNDIERFLESGKEDLEILKCGERRFLIALEKLPDNEKKFVLEQYFDIKSRHLEAFRKFQKKNSYLNDEEFASKKSSLYSYPKTLFLQFAGPCNSRCVFCSRGSDYEYFDLLTFQNRIERKIAHALMLAERIVFTGSGEFLLLPQKEEILEYFDRKYPYLEKMFSTNGTPLTPEICEKIASSQSKYVIHISLHASNNVLHYTLTRTSNFYKILSHLKSLLEIRKKTKNISVNFIFVATTLNIEDFPNFVRLAAVLGVDKVICYYNYIYVPAQKYLSCYFKPRLTNQMFDEAELIAKQLNIELQLPPRFKLSQYPNLGICREPWSQIMFNAQGQVLPCDVSGDCELSLKNNSFDKIWNSEYYLRLRHAFINTGLSSCFIHCHRANPCSVNDFRSHVIRRGRKDSEIDEFWEDNF